MSDYYYDFGWEYEDNKGTAYRSGAENKNYRVYKMHQNGRCEAMTDIMPRDEAITKLNQILLLDPAGQKDWLMAEKLEELRNERNAATSSYLRAKGRL